uniref:Phospholipid-transporting ATPase n=1 Tax=Amphimedon queenslandica TaxID=400682 RepID=A0A1X7U3D1_AMPQE
MADIESDEEGAVVSSEIPEVTQQEIEVAPAPAESPKEEVPEKLGDNDDESPSIWQRIKDLFPCLRYNEDLRRVTANNREENAQYKYANNVIKTAKYNIITFLPINLLEQFLRIANFYFLILVILQAIPGISSVPVYSTLVPLLGVLATTAIKDAYDDIKRHISDYRINSRPADIVKPDTDETNLKVRQALPETADMKDNENDLGSFNGYVECEVPNNRLHKFVGSLAWNNEKHSLSNDQILLRGCRLRNTEWMYGLVVYAGHDTKLVKNSGRTKFKRTHIDNMMNKMVLFILGFLGFCVTVTLIGSAIWESLYGTNFQVYVPFDTRFDNPAKIAFVQIISNIIVFNTFVPISLYVSVEVIRLGLSFIINWDLKMYYETNDIPAIARTTTLNEELGQIEYVFSDKTGTLTQNIMKFRKCTINGVKYGEPTVESKPIDFSPWNPYAQDDFEFCDNDLVELCRSGKDPFVEDFFKLIALCHTVLPSQDAEGKLDYNAQSPDEAALVSAARNLGYAFTTRTPFTVSVDLLNREQHGLPSSVNYEVLNILDFNNERKRMSVIVRDPETGKLTLYCKGADTVIFERLDPSCDELQSTTLEHLGTYATEGLRTLVLAKKDIGIDEYTEWSKEYTEASLLTEGRDLAVDKIYNKIEQNLILIGATAIEDKLQDGVPETIANLARADIKIWVLTGDKLETAINIGYSCKLLTEEMKIFIVNSEEKAEVRERLQDAKDWIDKKDSRPEPTTDEPQGPPYGIVLTGQTLRHALKADMEMLLLETASQCKAVICCRVTPLQKKKVVDLIKVHKKAVTLAIGDGANDVGMIKAAHIGVGISGLEGQQAVLSSDYSFGQFRYLERLLLVHGRWSYHRMTLFLKYFFYKNFAFTFSQFLFAFFCGFTAQTLYDPGFIAVYNVIYTSFPVLAIGILDQDCTEKSCLQNPRLYIAGQKGKRFNTQIFLISLLRGICVAIVVFFVLYGFTYLNVYHAGYEWDYQSFGYAASGALIFIVNLQMAMDTNYWNPVIHIFIWGSILSWWVVPPFLSNVPYFYNFNVLSYYGVSNEVLASFHFYFYTFLAMALALLPVFFARIILTELFPSLLDDVRLSEDKISSKERAEWFKGHIQRALPGKKEELLEEEGRVTPVSSGLLRHQRSSYAFAHEEGFGSHILTGRYLGANEKEVHSERTRRNTLTLGRPGSRPKKPSPLEVSKSAMTLPSDSKTLKALDEVQGSASASPVIELEVSTKKDEKESLVETID